MAKGRRTGKRARLHYGTKIAQSPHGNYSPCLRTDDAPSQPHDKHPGPRTNTVRRLLPRLYVEGVRGQWCSRLRHAYTRVPPPPARSIAPPPRKKFNTPFLCSPPLPHRTPHPSPSYLYWRVAFLSFELQEMAHGIEALEEKFRRFRATLLLFVGVAVGGGGISLLRTAVGASLYQQAFLTLKYTIGVATRVHETPRAADPLVESTANGVCVREPAAPEATRQQQSSGKATNGTQQQPEHNPREAQPPRLGPSGTAKLTANGGGDG